MAIPDIRTTHSATADTLKPAATLLEDIQLQQTLNGIGHLQIKGQLHGDKLPASDTTTVAILASNEKKPSDGPALSLRERVQKIVGDEVNTIGIDPRGRYFPDRYGSLFHDHEIQNALGGGDRQLISYILEHALATFATLVLVFKNRNDLHDAIRALCRNKFTDDDLCRQDDSISSSLLQVCECGAPCEHPFPRSTWDGSEVDTFKSKRWAFLVPKFEKAVFQYEFNSATLLPFVQKVPKGVIPSGHFSEVSRVEMLSTKQDKESTTKDTIIVALKTLKPLDDPHYTIDTEWRREAKAHRELNEKSDHIIKAFAAVRQVAPGKDRLSDRYHLVLEWADGGSLFSYWETHPEPQLDHEHVERSRQRVRDLLKQLCGLAGALCGMHSTSAQTPDQSRRGSVGSAPSPLALSPHNDPQPRDADVPPMNGLPVPKVNVENIDIVHHITTTLGPLPTVSVSAPDEGIGETKLPLKRANTNRFAENWRHGDIKPENILRFIGDNDDADLGLLKLADLGRSRQHHLATKMRETKETERFRTRWYEPPDLETKNHLQAGGKISRLFDIWSMGCVIFESVLWLLYGHDSVTHFMVANGLTPGEYDATPYWRKRNDGTYEVSNVATEWMNHILEQDPERSGAIGCLVELVRDRALKIQLPEYSDVPEVNCRTNAQDLQERLQSIIEATQNDESLLFSGTSRATVKPPKLAISSNSGPQSLLAPKAAGHYANPGHKTAINAQRQYTTNITDDWKIVPNDDFANAYLAGKDYECSETTLCDTCKSLDILSSPISFDMDKVETNSIAHVCDLCDLVYTAAKKLPLADCHQIWLSRSGNSLVLGDSGPKFLRLCHVGKAPAPDIPLGAPELTVTGEDVSKNLDTFSKLPKAWLDDCNKNHPSCHHPKSNKSSLPKRLISLKSPRRIKIVSTKEEELNPTETKYLALSHKWGEMPPEATTTRGNLTSRQNLIDMKEMPKTFQHAIAITRALKFDYLWIDSLCILQGLDGDFNEEADTMQATFSNADCILAACSAAGATHGFSRERELYQYVKMGDVFVSLVTDDFERDVLRSPLNRRGWVLQERALARRTIFFTDMQMYWECGESIRCETLTKLENATVAFLGDANFPAYTYTFGKGKRTLGDQISLFMDLFQNYTRLEFTHPEDRPIAIDGLMVRLTDAFKTQSLAGLFKTFWGRCLLWRRAPGSAPLEKIPTGVHTRKAVPTWSWMAFKGPISFIQPQGGQAEWQENDIVLPLPPSGTASWLSPARKNDKVAIVAKRAFDYNMTPRVSESESVIIYDNGDKPEITKTKCVIIGSDKVYDSIAERRHYVLIIKAIPGSRTACYERVGAGFILEKSIVRSNPTQATIE